MHPEDASIAVVIPVLDEAQNLPLVLDALPGWVDRVVVCDNGSSDGSADVARALGAEVVVEPRRGYGSAVKRGVARLRDSTPPDILVIADADFADHVDLLHRIVGPILRGEADLVISDRSVTAEPGALTTVQRFGNGLAVRLMAAVSGHRYRDMGPLRALSWPAYERLQMEDPTWGWNVEMQLKALNRGFRVREVPMPYRKRRHGRSKISGTLSGSVRAGARILQAVARYHSE